MLTSVPSDKFSGILEMIIMKLNYIFAPLLLLLYFVQGRVKDFIFCILEMLVGLTPLYLNKKRKWADTFWVKIWVFSHKTQKFSYKS